MFKLQSAEVTTYDLIRGLKYMAAKGVELINIIHNDVDTGLELFVQQVWRVNHPTTGYNQYGTKQEI